ncbi:hypothetical protein N7530_003048 [Penicillium desertorum]|uniref:Uncharacterized protein n=1 Tax=Penicillium desertorum TaxID=1303715 RepID=A0A9X0BTN8_9EURO|nr:hypothetical protein N7530_003048 [Penicillium desertorum]
MTFHNITFISLLALARRFPRWYETNSTDNVVVTSQGLDVFVIIRRVPQLDRKIRAAGNQENPAGCVAIINVIYRHLPDPYCEITGAGRD